MPWKWHACPNFRRKDDASDHATLVTAKLKNCIQLNLNLKLVFRFNSLLESYQNCNKQQVQAVLANETF